MMNGTDGTMLTRSRDVKEITASLGSFQRPKAYTGKRARGMTSHEF